MSKEVVDASGKITIYVTDSPASEHDQIESVKNIIEDIHNSLHESLINQSLEVVNYITRIACVIILWLAMSPTRIWNTWNFHVLLYLYPIEFTRENKQT
jgi:hypothetical protein